MMPERKWFFINIWWAGGFLQIIGVVIANKIKIRNKPE
jgi:hypothetical protein